MLLLLPHLPYSRLPATLPATGRCLPSCLPACLLPRRLHCHRHLTCLGPPLPAHVTAGLHAAHCTAHRACLPALDAAPAWVQVPVCLPVPACCTACHCLPLPACLDSLLHTCTRTCLPGRICHPPLPASCLPACTMGGLPAGMPRYHHRRPALHTLTSPATAGSCTLVPATFLVPHVTCWMHTCVLPAVDAVPACLYSPACRHFLPGKCFLVHCLGLPAPLPPLGLFLLPCYGAASTAFTCACLGSFYTCWVFLLGGFSATATLRLQILGTTLQACSTTCRTCVPRAMITLGYRMPALLPHRAAACTDATAACRCLHRWLPELPPAATVPAPLPRHATAHCLPAAVRRHSPSRAACCFLPGQVPTAAC